MLFRRAFVGLSQTVCYILNVQTDDCCYKVQYSYLGHISLHVDIFYRSPNLRGLDVGRPRALDGMKITITVFVQTLNDEISLKNINKTFLPVTVDPTT